MSASSNSPCPGTPLGSAYESHRGHRVQAGNRTSTPENPARTPPPAPRAPPPGLSCRVGHWRAHPYRRVSSPALSVARWAQFHLRPRFQPAARASRSPFRTPPSGFPTVPFKHPPLSSVRSLPLRAPLGVAPRPTPPASIDTRARTAFGWSSSIQGFLRPQCAGLGSNTAT